MVRSIKRIHQTCKPQRWGPWEQSLPQILWGLEVLKVLHKELRSGEILHHTFHLLLLIITQHHDFIDSENGGGLGNLPSQVSFQLHGLSIVNYRSWNHDSHRKVSKCFGVVVLRCSVEHRTVVRIRVTLDFFLLVLFVFLLFDLLRVLMLFDNLDA